MTKKQVRIEICGKEISFETGEIARLSGGSVIARCGDTIVFSSICHAKSSHANILFCPLRVDYQEKFSASGKTVGGFIKREGRPSEKEILVSRLIDRSLRPLFLKGFNSEIQSISMVWSYDKQNSPDILAICASSAALALSNLPTKAHVGAVRVGLINGSLVVNPSIPQLEQATFDCTFSGTRYGLTMVEGHGKSISESILLDAADLAIVSIKSICEAIAELEKEAGKEKISFTINSEDLVEQSIRSSWTEPVRKIFEISNKLDRQEAIQSLKQEITSTFPEEHLSAACFGFESILREEAKNLICIEGKRIDNRGQEDIRSIHARCGFLPCVHGSAIFTRGQTQSVAVCTLGSEQMSQRFENLDGEGAQRFYLHYFFPHFCVGEVGKIGSPGRRELGHGKLAEKALESVLPDKASFPYVIRVESTITESSGSSSMASVCGGCLALIDAGVPIKEPVAGIAMGLFLNSKTGEAEAILSDISEIEDMLGDMDFKLAGTQNGFTALQMDVKVRGIPLAVLGKAIKQAGIGIKIIIGHMIQACPQINRELPDHVPRIATVKIPLNKIAILIGSSGRTIRSICEQSHADINIEDGTGIVYISAQSKQAISKAKQMIEDVTAELEIGKVYHGKIKSVAAFGLFVEVMSGKEGLCHVSEISQTGPNVLQNYKIGEMIDVKVVDINLKGQIKLTEKIK